MTKEKLQTIVTTAIAVDQKIAELTETLKDLKADLVAEAESRTEEQTVTDGGGRSWTAQDAAGNIARVTFPGPAIKASISGEGKGIERLREASGAFFTRLFVQAPKYIPAPNFRDEAAALLGRDARKLIRLCETKSAPRVSFETKELPK